VPFWRPREDFVGQKGSRQSQAIEFVYLDLTRASRSVPGTRTITVLYCTVPTVPTVPGTYSYFAGNDGSTPNLCR
jgi:hypothetical protein